MACLSPLAPGDGLMFRMGNWLHETTIAVLVDLFLTTYAVVALGKIPVYGLTGWAVPAWRQLWSTTGVLSTKNSRIELVDSIDRGCLA